MAQDLGPNAHLIGQADSRANLMTPALVLDLDALERNINTMAEFAAAHGLGLRPHAKTHKSVAVAKLQQAAGALGISCATIGEAGVMVEAGIAGVLVTSPVVSTAKIARLMELNSMADALKQVVDNLDNLRALDSAAGAAGKPLEILVDIDVGLHRTGAASAGAAVALVEALMQADNLIYAGVQAYGGHLQHIEDFGARQRQTKTDLEPLAATCAALNDKGLTPAIISGGGTGTHDIDADQGLLNELQVGSYAVMDVEYLDVHCRDAGAWRFTPGLFVRASVVSANHDGTATIDAGLKCFATDGPLPRFASGVPHGAGYAYFGDEHGQITFGRANERLGLGQAVEIVVPHCDPTVNLYDLYHCVRGDVLVDIWPVDARGLH